MTSQTIMHLGFEILLHIWRNTQGERFSDDQR